MRLSRGELRDHINCRKNDRWPSYRFYRALQRLKSPMRNICEIFGAQRFSSFSTQLGPQRTSFVSKRVFCPLTHSRLAPRAAFATQHLHLLSAATIET